MTRLLALQLSASIETMGLVHEYPVNRDILVFFKSDSLPLVHDGNLIYLSVLATEYGNPETAKFCSAGTCKSIGVQFILVLPRTENHEKYVLTE